MKKTLLSLLILIALIAFSGCLAVEELVSTLDQPSAVELELTLSEVATEVVTETSQATSTTIESQKSEAVTVKPAPVTTKESMAQVVEEGSYTRPKEVALYIHTYGRLPANYIDKDSAIALGWDNKKGNLWDVTDQMSIGGDYFGNREGLLPKASGRKWFECDVNYKGGYRGAERLVYSNDGLIYYTKDHYESFTLLYD